MLPRVVLHNAVSVDGRIDGFTPDLGLFYGLASRWGEDATLAGSETILAADWGSAEASEPEGLSEATAPEGSTMEDREEVPSAAPDDGRPLLVIPDSRGRVRGWDALRGQPYWRDVVCLCSRATPRSYLDYLEELRVDRIVAGEDRVDLRAALEELNARYGVKLVRADSGGVLNGALLRAGLVDEISLLICSSMVGSSTCRSIFRVAASSSAEVAIPVRLTHLERMDGNTVWLRYEVVQ